MTDHKHVALFLDGTWNTVNDNTNVWRLKSLYDSGPDQKVYYSAGVGTAKGEKYTGGLFGFEKRCQGQLLTAGRSQGWGWSAACPDRRGEKKRCQGQFLTGDWRSG